MARASKQALVKLNHALEQKRTTFAELLPNKTEVTRYLRLILLNAAATPDLLKCDPQSIIRAALQAARFGLEPGVDNRAHIVPYYSRKTQTTNANFQIGYEGLRQLALETELFKAIDVEVVYENDEFELLKTDEGQTWTHKPCTEGDPGPMKCIYAYAIYVDGPKKLFHMTAHQLAEFENEFIRAMRGGPWVSGKWSKLGMQRKTVLRALCKQLPRKAPSLIDAIAADEASELGKADVSDLVVEAIDAEFEDVPEPPKAEAAASAIKQRRAARKESSRQREQPQSSIEMRAQHFTDLVDEAFQNGQLTADQHDTLREHLKSSVEANDLDAVNKTLDMLTEEISR